MGRKKVVIISKATVADIENIACLHAISWQENYREALSADFLDNKVLADRMALWTMRLNTPTANQSVFIAYVEDELVGFISIFGANHKTYGTIIDNLHVKGNYKGYGLGTRLLNTAALWANEHYANVSLYLEVLACNVKAMGFYSSLGANNIAASYWQTPCNNKTKEYVYSWPSIATLIAKSTAFNHDSC